MAYSNAGFDEFELPGFGAVDDFDAISAAMGILSQKMEAVSAETLDDEFEVTLHGIANGTHLP